MGICLRPEIAVFAAAPVETARSMRFFDPEISFIVKTARSMRFGLVKNFVHS